MEIADTPLSVLGNEDALLTVLQNLVMNSLEAGATEVIVSCQSAGTERNSQVMIGIVDNGPGIADSVQAHVFDPFFTVRETLRLQSGYFGIRDNDGNIRDRVCARSFVGDGPYRTD